jgi:hypothetical protein
VKELRERPLRRAGRSQAGRRPGGARVLDTGPGRRARRSHRGRDQPPPLPHRLGQASVFTGVGPAPAGDDEQKRIARLLLLQETGTLGRHVARIIRC